MCLAITDTDTFCENFGKLYFESSEKQCVQQKKQCVQQTLNTLKTLNDAKFDLMTPRTLNSNKFKQNGLENPYLKSIPKRFSFNKNSQTYLLFSNSSLEVKSTALKLEIFGLKNEIARCLISQSGSFSDTLLIVCF